MNTPALDKVLEEVRNERFAQDQKWGTQDHEAAKYLAILGEEFGEAAKEVVEMTFTNSDEQRAKHAANLREELVQTAAVAVAMVEALDRAKKLEPSTTV